VRVAVGNGLRADIWDQFKQRYNIPNICEFFGATEGVAGFVNLNNKTGSCGRYSPVTVNKLFDFYLLFTLDYFENNIV
jgi:acyl-coenzyme A synthetase/AMP-(fatty) acid ligase